MGLHACLARRVVTRRPGAGNCLCPTSDELIRGNEINKSKNRGSLRGPMYRQAFLLPRKVSQEARAVESRVGLGTRVSAHSGPQEKAGPGHTLGMHGTV